MATSQADGGTRSGLLWECERILNELYDTHTHSLPQVLLMENVPEVIGANNVKHFNKWLDKLESLGYQNYFQILNAKHYGIPQNRKRCFMVSILGDYAYDFPLKQKKRHYLNEFIEDNVEEKYFLSDKDIERISNWKSFDNPIELAINVKESNKDMPCLTARGAGEEHSGMKLLAIPLETECEGGVMIKENNSQGYKVAHEGDGVNIASRMKHQRGNVQHGSIQTLKAQMEIGVVVNEHKKEDL